MTLNFTSKTIRFEGRDYYGYTAVNDSEKYGDHNGIYATHNCAEITFKNTLNGFYYSLSKEGILCVMIPGTSEGDIYYKAPQIYVQQKSEFLTAKEINTIYESIVSITKLCVPLTPEEVEQFRSINK